MINGIIFGFTNLTDRRSEQCSQQTANCCSSVSKLTFIQRHTSASLSCNRVLKPQSAVCNRQCKYTVSSSTDMSTANGAQTRAYHVGTGSTDRTEQNCVCVCVFCTSFVLSLLPLSCLSLHVL